MSIGREPSKVSYRVVIKKLDLVRKMVETRTFSVAVMGMGYVGLTLSVVLARNGIKVHGISK